MNAVAAHKTFIALKRGKLYIEIKYNFSSHKTKSLKWKITVLYYVLTVECSIFDGIV